MTNFQAETIVRDQDIDPPTLTLTRRLGAGVRAAREKLTTSDTGHRSSDLGLIGAYARNRIDFLPIDLGLIVLALWLAHEAIPDSLLFLWTLAGLAGLTVRQLGARRLTKEGESKTPLRRRRARILLAEGLNGLFWASAIFPFLQTGRPAPVVVALLLVLRAGVDALANATIPLAVYAALGPAAMGLVIYLVCVYPGQDAAQLLSLLALSLFLFLDAAGRLHCQLADRLLLQIEIDERITELERAKASSDAARCRAEEASLAKSRFLATMSHE